MQWFSFFVGKSDFVANNVGIGHIFSDIALPIQTGSVLAVMCEDNFFFVWLQLERESCIAAVEDLLTKEDCWRNRYYGLSDVDLVNVANFVRVNA